MGQQGLPTQAGLASLLCPGYAVCILLHSFFLTLEVSNPNPLAEMRLRLDAENRGVVPGSRLTHSLTCSSVDAHSDCPGTRDVVTMMINWASRTDFVAAVES